MKRTLEREVKLQAESDFELPELGGERLDPRSFVSTYYDTQQHRLATHGVTLRHRVENGKGLWQLKLPRGAARLELEVEGGPVRVPEDLSALLVAYLRGEEPVPVARLRTRRQSVRVEGTEVVHDSVAVLDDQRVARSFDELEVELLEGDERVLRRLEKALRRAGAGQSKLRRPKLFRALDLEYQPDQQTALPTASPAEVVEAQIRIHLVKMLAHDPGVRIGDDPEDVHQLRVATRRLRAFLRAARGLVDEAWGGEVRDGLKRLADALGAVRDREVLLERFGAALESLEPRLRRDARPLVRALERERSTARRALLEVLGGAEYFRLLDRIETGPPLHTASAADPSLSEVWGGEFRKLRKAMWALGPNSADEDLHAARIKVKKARYAAELGAPVFGKRARTFVSPAKDLQDVLGEHQDSAVAEGRLSELAQSAAPATAFVAGRLAELERSRRLEARAAWPAAWSRLEHGGKALAAKVT